MMLSPGISSAAGAPGPRCGSRLVELGAGDRGGGRCTRSAGPCPRCRAGRPAARRSRRPAARRSAPPGCRPAGRSREQGCRGGAGGSPGCPARRRTRCAGWPCWPWWSRCRRRSAASTSTQLSWYRASVRAMAAPTTPAPMMRDVGGHRGSHLRLPAVITRSQRCRRPAAVGPKATALPFSCLIRGDRRLDDRSSCGGADRRGEVRRRRRRRAGPGPRRRARSRRGRGRPPPAPAAGRPGPA